MRIWTVFREGPRIEYLFSLFFLLVLYIISFRYYILFRCRRRTRVEVDKSSRCACDIDRIVNYY